MKQKLSNQLCNGSGREKSHFPNKLDSPNNVFSVEFSGLIEDQVLIMFYLKFEFELKSSPVLNYCNCQ